MNLALIQSLDVYTDLYVSNVGRQLLFFGYCCRCCAQKIRRLLLSATKPEAALLLPKTFSLALIVLLLTLGWRYIPDFYRLWVSGTRRACQEPLQCRHFHNITSSSYQIMQRPLSNANTHTFLIPNNIPVVFFPSTGCCSSSFSKMAADEMSSANDDDVLVSRKKVNFQFKQHIVRAELMKGQLKTMNAGNERHCWQTIVSLPTQFQRGIYDLLNQSEALSLFARQTN